MDVVIRLRSSACQRESSFCAMYSVESGNVVRDAFSALRGLRAKCALLFVDTLYIVNLVVSTAQMLVRL
jgi:hypothetical protein